MTPLSLSVSFTVICSISIGIGFPIWSVVLYPLSLFVLVSVRKFVLNKSGVVYLYFVLCTVVHSASLGKRTLKLERTYSLKKCSTMYTMQVPCTVN